MKLQLNKLIKYVWFGSKNAVRNKVFGGSDYPMNGLNGDYNKYSL